VLTKKNLDEQKANKSLVVMEEISLRIEKRKINFFSLSSKEFFFYSKNL